MNIASFLVPKSMVVYLYDDYSLRQGLEKMRYHGRAEVPVITRENEYVGTLSEGDLLRYLTDYIKSSEKDKKAVEIRDFESVIIRDFLYDEKNPPVRINTSCSDILERAANQNFIPVIDDRNSFIGIVTRKAVITQLSRELKQFHYEKIFCGQSLPTSATVNS